MMAMEMFAELLDTATDDAHKPKGHQNIPLINNCRVCAVNDQKCKYLILYELAFQIFVI
jgi:hypothetical protein